MAAGFEELDVYKAAKKLRQRMYKLAKLLPDEERFGLAPQMRRASVSLTNNIAEGHGSRSYKLNISYLYRSRGSLYELIDDFSVCEDAGYFKQEHLAVLRADAQDVAKLINGYIAFLRKKLDPPNNSTSH